MFLVLFAILCTHVHLFPVPQTVNMKGVYTQTSSVNATVKRNPSLKSVLSEISPDRSIESACVNGTARQPSSMKHTPGLDNISTKMRGGVRDITEHSINLTAASRYTVDTAILLDNENESTESSVDSLCISKRTEEVIRMPCGGLVVRRPRRCNFNNVFHIRQSAVSLIRVMVGKIFQFGIRVERFPLQHYESF